MQSAETELREHAAQHLRPAVWPDRHHALLLQGAAGRTPLAQEGGLLHPALLLHLARRGAAALLRPDAVQVPEDDLRPRARHRLPRRPSAGLHQVTFTKIGNVFNDLLLSQECHHRPVDPGDGRDIWRPKQQRTTEPLVLGSRGPQDSVQLRINDLCVKNSICYI